MSISLPRVSKRFFVLTLILPVAGCSGVQQSSQTNVSVQLSKTSVTLAAGAQQQFTATVQGTSNTAVTWSVDSVAGGNATVGTITTAGMYTAPSAAGNHTVTATSVADTAASASASVTVTAGLSVAPSTAFVLEGGTQQFTATLPGVTSPAVSWSVDSVAGGNATVGTITSAGLYTAPSTTGNHTVTATDTATTTETASAAVTVTGTLSISPPTATVIGGVTQQFTATLPGVTSPTISWSVDGVGGGNSTVGTISSSGVYTAPSQAGNHTIEAAVTQPTTSASAAVTVFTFSLSPGVAIVDPSATQQFTATISGLSNTHVTWSVDGTAGGSSASGTITAGGLYTAPSAIGPHTITATSTGDPSASLNSQVTVVDVAQSAVLTYHNDDARDGAYTQEVTLTPANVNSTQFGKIVSYPVDGQIYGQVLYMPQVTINGTPHDVVYVSTQNNSLYAFDADATSATPTTFWHDNFGPAVTKDSEYGAVVVGVLSTPVIDASTNTIYVVAESSSGSLFTLHALDLATGAEKFGGPDTVTGSVIGTEGGGSSHTITLESSCLQRTALALDPVTNAIYMGFGDCIHGWVIAYSKSTMGSSVQPLAVFNVTPNDNGGGGMWSGGGAPTIDDTTGDLYLLTGVDFGDDIASGDSISTGYNDAFLHLSGSNLSVSDYFIPDNAPTLATNDADLDAGGNILVPGSTTYPNITIGGGKDGNIYVVNRDNMGGYNFSSQQNNVLQTVVGCSGSGGYDNIFSTPVYWNGSLYYHCNNDAIRAYSWDASTNTLSTSATSIGTAVFQTHGATASLSANGTTNGIVWDIDNTAYNGTTPTQSGPAVLHAYDATNVANELYNSTQAGTRDTAGAASKFTVPTIANGRVFVPGSVELDIYGELNP